MKMLNKKGQVVQQVTGGVISLVIGVAVATMALIFTSVMGAQVYTQSLLDLKALNTTNNTLYVYTMDGIAAGFEGLGNTGKYLPLIVLSVVIFIVMALLTSFNVFNRQGGNYQAL